MGSFFCLFSCARTPLKKIFNIATKDLLLEWKQKFAIAGILVYVIATVFIIYLSFKNNSPVHFNGLLWIVVLNAVLSYATKSYMQESRNRNLYYYFLMPPSSMIIAKMIVNMAVSVVLSLVNLLVFSAVLDLEIGDLWRYLAFVFSGTAALGAMFTMLAAIASQTRNGALIMPVISFPIQIPLFLIILKGSIKALEGATGSGFYTDIALIWLLTGINFLLAGILYPFLSKE